MLRPGVCSSDQSEAWYPSPRLNQLYSAQFRSITAGTNTQVPLPCRKTTTEIPSFHPTTKSHTNLRSSPNLQTETPVADRELHHFKPNSFWLNLNTMQALPQPTWAALLSPHVPTQANSISISTMQIHPIATDDWTHQAPAGRLPWRRSRFQLNLQVPLPVQLKI